MRFEVLTKDDMNALSRELSRAGIMNRTQEETRAEIEHYIVIRGTYAELVEVASSVLENYDRFMSEVNFYRALEEVLRLSSFLNKFVDEKAPWELAKRGDDSLKDVLYTLVDGLFALAYLLYPFTPNKMKEAFSMLGVEGTPTRIRPSTFESYRVGERRILFPRRDA